MNHFSGILCLLWTVLAPFSLDAQISLTGRVLTMEGAALSQARVDLVPVVSTFELGRLRTEGSPEPPPASTVRTDPSGEFALAAPEAGMWLVRVSAPSYVPLEYHLTPLLAPTRLPPARLEPMESLVVHVSDQGSQKAKAGILVEAVSTSRQEEWGYASLFRWTDQDHALTVPCAASAELALTVSVPGRPILSAKGSCPGTLRPELTEGAKRLVRIRDASDQAVPGALAWIDGATWPAGVSDEEGHLWLFTDPRNPDPLVDVATADGRFTSLRWSPKATTVDLTLPPAALVAGRVLDASTRKAVAGAFVWPYSAPGDAVLTDSAGNYLLPPLRHPAPEILAVRTGYLEAQQEPRRLNDSQWQGPAIALQPATATVAGLVVDGDGQPVADARVTVANRGLGLFVSTYTSPEGSFAFDRLPASTRFALSADREGFVRSGVALPTLDEHEWLSDLRLVLHRGVTLFGTLADPRGEPIVGARIVLPHGDPAQGKQSFSDATGRFEVARVGPGEFKVEIHAEGFASISRYVDVSRVDLDLGLVTLEESIALRGRVVSTNSEPVAGAKVVADNVPGATAAFHVRTASTSDGSFVLDGLRPGAVVRLEVTHADHVARDIPSIEVPTSEPLEIVLQPAVSLAGRVLDQDRRPVAEALVWVAPIPSVFVNLNQETDEEGRFRFHGLTPGSARLEAMRPGYQWFGIDVDLRPEEPQDLEIVLEPEALIEGQVRGADGRPLAGAGVSVRDETGFGNSWRHLFQRAVTDADGFYQLRYLAPGRVTLEGSFDQSETRKDVVVRPGRQRVDLVLESKARTRVEGRVVDRQGVPVGGLQLALSRVIGRARMQASNAYSYSQADGSFVFHDVSAGEYVIATAREGGDYISTEETPVVVGGQAVTGLVVEVAAQSSVAGALLGLEETDLGQVRVWAATSEGGRFGGQVDVSTRSYRIPELPPGSWLVEAEVLGRGRRASATVTVDEGEATVLDLDFAAGLALRGQVVEDGQALLGARVSLRRADDSRVPASAVTGPDGRFSIEGLEPDTYELEVALGSRTIHRESVEVATDEELAIEVSRGRLEGELRDATTREALAGVRIRLSDAGGLEVVSTAGGRFQISPVAPGPVRLLAVKPGYEPLEAAFEVDPGEILDVGVLEMRPTPGSP